MKEAWGITPSNQQTAALKSLARGSKITIASGHDTGKTTMLSWAIIWFQFTNIACRVPCTAGTKSQLRTVLWPEINVWLDRSPKEIRSAFEWQTEMILKKNNPLDNFAVARTARKEAPDALQGYHHKNIMFVVDEAPGVPDEVFQVAEGAISTVSAIMIMTGNPTKLSGEFYRSHHKDKHLWDSYVFSCIESSLRPKDKEAYAARQAAKWGKDSDIYRVRVLGQFPRQESNTYIPLHLAMEAAGKEKPKVYDDEIIVWGIDPARYGDCEFALCKRKGQHVYFIDGIRKNDAGEAINWLEMQALKDKGRPNKLIIDEIGMGGPIGDILKQKGWNVVFCDVNKAAKDPSYNRMRDELWKNGKEFLELGGVIPNDEDLIGQLTTTKYSFPNGKISIESKDDIKKDGRPSPDRADAFNLTHYSGNPLFKNLK